MERLPCNQKSETRGPIPCPLHRGSPPILPESSDVPSSKVTHSSYITSK